MANFEIIASVLIRCKSGFGSNNETSKEYSATITFADGTSIVKYHEDWYHALRLVNELADRTTEGRKVET